MRLEMPRGAWPRPHHGRGCHGRANCEQFFDFPACYSRPLTVAFGPGKRICSISSVADGGSRDVDVGRHCGIGHDAAVQDGGDQVVFADDALVISDQNTPPQPRDAAPAGRCRARNPRVLQLRCDTMRPLQTRRKACGHSALIQIDLGVPSLAPRVSYVRNRGDVMGTVFSSISRLLAPARHKGPQLGLGSDT